MLHGISAGHIMAAALSEHVPTRPEAGSPPIESMREGEALVRPCFLATAPPSPCARPPSGGRSAKRTQGGQSDG